MRVVRRIFEMAAEGISVHGIKRALDLDGVSTPIGCPYWHWRAVHSFIINPTHTKRLGSWCPAK